MTRRLLTIGHSYVVAQNRRLADEMARQSSGRWEVTVAAPAQLQGDLRWIDFEPIDGEASIPVRLPVWFGSHPHLRAYGSGFQSLARQPWDLVHCWEEPYVLAAAQIAFSIRRETRFVPATFQNIAKRYPWPVALLEQRVVRRAAGWIAFGETIHETHRNRRGYSTRPSRVITPGVDTDVFTPDAESRRAIRRKFGWDDGTVVAGFAGRFIEAKGIGALLGALTHAAGEWKLLFVGGGPLQPDIERARQQHPSRIAVATDIPHALVPAYLNAMDLLCAPSRTTPRWREQFGRMLIEAMACGVPVVASRSGEIPHVVGDAGVLLPEDDSAAWASAIDRLAEDGAARRELRERGLDRARTQFAWPIVARAHLQFFEELCAS